MPSNCFFIFGMPRSGTTFLSKVLDMATNANVHIEQSPKLGYESRQKHLGRFQSSKKAIDFIKYQKDEFITQVNEKGLIYGDKNPNFLPFLIEMSEAWPSSKFVYIYRDGRDVVTSLLNWNGSGKNIFQMYEDGIENGAKYPVQDLWDYSRIRPLINEKYHDKWKFFSLFEKCCVYWSYYNEIAMEKVTQIKKERVFHLNVTYASADTYESLFKFLGLLGFDNEYLELLVYKKVNTSSFNDFKNWTDWTETEKLTYEKYCANTHKKLIGQLNWN